MPNAIQTVPFERVVVVPFECKDYNSEAHTAWMIVSSEAKDRAGERVAQEALREAWPRYLHNPVWTWAHKAGELPIGHAIDIDFRPAATAVQVAFSDATEMSRAVFKQVTEGTLRAASIGFNPYSKSFGAHADGTPDFETGEEGLVWRRVDWMENAVCTIPCNQEAVREFGKSLGLAMEAPVVAPSEPPPLTEEEAEALEDARAFDDLKRMRASLTSIENITTHWQQKHGRALSPEYRAELEQASLTIAAILEPHPGLTRLRLASGAPSAAALQFAQ